MLLSYTVVLQLANYLSCGMVSNVVAESSNTTSKWLLSSNLSMKLVKG